MIVVALIAARSDRVGPGTPQAQDYQARIKIRPECAARLGYMEGSVSFQPAGESEWVQAVSNRPMTTGDADLG